MLHALAITFVDILIGVKHEARTFSVGAGRPSKGADTRVTENIAASSPAYLSSSSISTVIAGGLLAIARSSSTQDFYLVPAAQGKFYVIIPIELCSRTKPQLSQFHGFLCR